MKYLLDANALIALRHSRSPAHAKFHAWAKKAGFASLHTCAMCELGFIRVSIQAFGYDAAQAAAALAEIKGQIGGYVSEAPSPVLPAWANNGAKTSDAYLLQVAESAGLKLATFDRGIPDAHVIA